MCSCRVDGDLRGNRAALHSKPSDSGHPLSIEMPDRGEEVLAGAGGELTDTLPVDPDLNEIFRISACCPHRDELAEDKRITIGCDVVREDVLVMLFACDLQGAAPG